MADAAGGRTTGRFLDVHGDNRAIRWASTEGATGRVQFSVGPSGVALSTPELLFGAGELNLPSSGYAYFKQSPNELKKFLIMNPLFTSRRETNSDFTIAEIWFREFVMISIFDVTPFPSGSGKWQVCWQSGHCAPNTAEWASWVHSNEKNELHPHICPCRRRALVRRGRGSDAAGTRDATGHPGYYR
jgi:hypothetical protein